MSSVFEQSIYGIGVNYDHVGVVHLHSKPEDVMRFEERKVSYTTFEALGDSIVHAVETGETNFIRIHLPSQAINDADHTVFLFQPPDEYILSGDPDSIAESHNQLSYSFLIPVPQEEERAKLPVLTVQGNDHSLMLSRLDEKVDRRIAIAYRNLPDNHGINIKTHNYSPVRPRIDDETPYNILINTPKAIIFRLEGDPPFITFLCDLGKVSGDINYMDVIINPQAIPKELFRNR